MRFIFGIRQIAVWLTQPPIQRLLGFLSSGTKRQEREADQSPPSTAEVKNGGAISSFRHMSSWHSA
jgi:hypothetical protein